MKPGDWAERELTVQNRGSEDFNYHLEVKRTSGSENLYEALVFEVRDAEKQLFKGTLDQFSGFPSRFLQSAHEEDIMLKIEFPAELGNEYQGLEVEVLFMFFSFLRGKLLMIQVLLLVKAQIIKHRLIKVD